MQPAVLLAVAIASASPLRAGNPNLKDQPIRQQSLHYVENKGQLGEPAVLYYTETNLGAVYLQRDRIVQHIKMASGEERASYRYDLELLGISAKAEMVPGSPSGVLHHFYTDPSISRGITDIPSYTRITYRNVYPDIDLVCYSDQGKFKYDFVVHPGGKVEDIKIHVHTDSDATVSLRDSILINTPIATVSMEPPYSYQDKGATQVNSRFKQLSASVFGFEVAKFDSSNDLIIDPTVGWCLLWGGDASDNALAVDVDPNDGSIYKCGSTSSGSFPGTVGLGSGYSGTFAHISKYNASGSLQWSVIFGGGNGELAQDIEVDPNGFIYVCGFTTNGGAFPATNSTWVGSGYDCWIAKFNPLGINEWSIPYGGTQDDFAVGLTIDNLNHVIFTGFTEAGNCSGNPCFPTTQYYSQTGGTPNSGNSDIIAVKFSSIGNRLWSTQFGINYSHPVFNLLGDVGSDLVTDANDNIYIAGRSISGRSFATYFSNVWESGTANISTGTHEAITLKLNSSGVYQQLAVIQMADAVASGNNAEANSIMLNASGEPILTGNYNEASSSGYSWETISSYSSSPYYNAFCIKLNTAMNGIEWGFKYGNTSSTPSLSEEVRSYSIEGTDNGDFIISGRIRQINSASLDPPFTISTWAIGTPQADNYDLYLAQFAESGTTASQVWSFRYSGAYDEAAYDLAVNGCAIYATGSTNGSYTGGLTQVLLPNAQTTYASSSSPTNQEAYLLYFECDPNWTTTLGCEDCLTSFAPFQNTKYVLSAWVREDAATELSEFTSPEIELDFAAAGTLGPFNASGPIIDGWQRIEAEFTVPATATQMTIDLINTSATSDVFFDDIRFLPMDGSMKSYVYDPHSHRLMAELDENNYAIYYEYDQEGKLVRIKRETERGIQTIQETRNNMAQ